MLITKQVLDRFGACSNAVREFENQYPKGLDISGLWGERGARDETWQRLLGDEFLCKQIGWAIGVGLIPARITGNLRFADLSFADLSGADLHGANLSFADLSDEQRKYAKGAGAIIDEVVVNPLPEEAGDERGM